LFKQSRKEDDDWKPFRIVPVDTMKNQSLWLVYKGLSAIYTAVRLPLMRLREQLTMPYIAVTHGVHREYI